MHNSIESTNGTKKNGWMLSSFNLQWIWIMICHFYSGESEKKWKKTTTKSERKGGHIIPEFKTLWRDRIHNHLLCSWTETEFKIYINCMILTKFNECRFWKVFIENAKRCMTTTATIRDLLEPTAWHRNCIDIVDTKQRTKQHEMK